MKHAPLSAAVITTAAAIAAALIPTAATAAAVTTAPPPNPARHQVNTRSVCGQATGLRARCFAEIRTDIHGGTGLRGPATQTPGHPATTALPPGYGPADLHAAYRLPATGGTGQTVAIVDAGDDPTAEQDLATYRATYGLPACTTANQCFRKVNQNGTANPPPADAGWGPEISLDLDMASAACPTCHILLVEANTPTISDLAAAEDTAATLGATEISNSYGAPEQNGMQPFQTNYTHPGVAIIASSGDSGYQIPNFPAVYPTVIAAGGTTLTKTPATTKGWTETAWNAAGSGCSAWINKPTWQHDPNCPGRMVTDIAADADPQTGVAVYDTNDKLGWAVFGGTSASSPLIAGIIALAGHPTRFPNASHLYTHTNALNDITTGNNTTTTDCGGDYQCNATPGYDGPTGNGTPNGLGAF